MNISGLYGKNVKNWRIFLYVRINIIYLLWMEVMVSPHVSFNHQATADLSLPVQLMGQPVAEQRSAHCERQHQQLRSTFTQNTLCRFDKKMTQDTLSPVYVPEQGLFLLVF